MSSLNRIPSKVPGYNTESVPVTYGKERSPLDREIYAQAAEWATTLLTPVSKLSFGNVMQLILVALLIAVATALISIGYPADITKFLAAGLKALPLICALSAASVLAGAVFTAIKQEVLFRFMAQSFLAAIVFTGLVLALRLI